LTEKIVDGVWSIEKAVEVLLLVVEQEASSVTVKVVVEEKMAGSTVVKVVVE